MRQTREGVWFMIPRTVQVLLIATQALRLRKLWSSRQPTKAQRSIRDNNRPMA